MDELAKKVASRHAGMSEEKLKEVMLKIRKGATANLSWGALGEVLAALDPGWKLEKTVGLVKMYGYHGGEDSAAIFVGLDRDGETSGVAEKRHAELAKDAVTSLPASPKHGKLYILELTPIQKNRFEQDYFECKPWMGHENWTLKSPSNKTFEAMPWRHNLGELQHGFRVSTRGKIGTDEALRWLGKETDFLDQINTKLGVGVFEPSAPRTRDKTGSCPVCFQNIKINNERMVLHGYKRPGTGSVHGNCFGVGYQAFELSDDGCKAYLSQSLRPSLADAQDWLRRLKAGEIKALALNHSDRKIVPTDKDWEYHLENAIRHAENNVQSYEKTIEDYDRLVKHWKVRPLPKEGDRHIDWYYQGQKA